MLEPAQRQRVADRAIVLGRLRLWPREGDRLALDPAFVGLQIELGFKRPLQRALIDKTKLDGRLAEAAAGLLAEPLDLERLLFAQQVGPSQHFADAAYLGRVIIQRTGRKGAIVGCHIVHKALPSLGRGR